MDLMVRHINFIVAKHLAAVVWCSHCPSYF